jgi:hypothetical protein
MMTADEMNATFREFALMFLGRLPVDEEIPFVENLNRSALDGSIESLAAVDNYLAFVCENLEHLTDSEYNNLVLRCGAYTGECIRTTWPHAYDWCDYDDYVRGHPKMKAILPERMLGTCALLTREPDAMNMPLNKVLRFLHEGPENSLHYFAHCERQYHQ